MTFMERHVPADIRTAVAAAQHLGDDSVPALLTLAAEYCTAKVPVFDDIDQKAWLVSARTLYTQAQLMIHGHITGKEWADSDMVLGVILIADDLVGEAGPDMGIAGALQHLTMTMPMVIDTISASAGARP